MKPIRLLSWDTRFFGFPIGQVCDGVDARAIAEAVKQAESERIDCLYLLAAAEDAELIDVAQQHGFLVRDVRIELDRTVPATIHSPAGLRRAGSGDLSRLESIARDRVRGTRFFADSRFPFERCTDLYVAWLHRGLHGAPERVTIMSEDASGFLVCRLDPRARSGTIELIAVSARAAGRGLGATLLGGADALFCEASLERASVATQACNIAAQRLYQRHGYRTRRAQLWLHRWPQAKGRDLSAHDEREGGEHPCGAA